MISKAEVKHVAKLARLGLRDREIEEMQKNLTSILDYIKLLEEIDISPIRPTFHSITIENVMRQDKVYGEKPEIVEKMIIQAPQREKRHIRVKGILE